MDGVSCGIGVILKYFTVYLHKVSKVNRLHKRPIGYKKGHDPTGDEELTVDYDTNPDECHKKGC